MKNNENNKKGTKKKGNLRKILIICVIIVSVFFVMGKTFDTASNKVESMSQEEKDAMNNKWDDLMDSLVSD